MKQSKFQWLTTCKTTGKKTTIQMVDAYLVLHIVSIWRPTFSYILVPFGDQLAGKFAVLALVWYVMLHEDMNMTVII